MIWPWLMNLNEEETSPPTLKEALDDGLDLWAFENEIPLQAREAVEDNFLYRRLCSEDIERFSWAFRTIIRKVQWRFLNLLKAEAYEYNPFITNMLNEANDRTFDSTDEHAGETGGGSETKSFSEEANSASTLTTHDDLTTTATEGATHDRAASARASKEASTELGEERGDSKRHETSEATKAGDTTRRTTNESARASDGTKASLSDTTEQGATKAKETGKSERTGTEYSEGASHEAGTDTTTEGKTTSAMKGESSNHSSGSRSEKTLSDDYERTTTDHKVTTTGHEGTEVTINTQDPSFSRTSETARVGTESRQRQGADIATAYPEQDSGAEIAALQAMAGGTISQPALTYATAGTFSGELEKSGYENRKDTTTDTRNGAEYSVKHYGVIEGIPGLTPTAREDATAEDSTSVQTGTGAEIDTEHSNESTRSDSSEAGTESSERKGESSKASSTFTDKSDRASEDSYKTSTTEDAKLSTGKASESESTTEHATENGAEIGTSTEHGSDSRREASEEVRARKGETDRESTERSEETRGGTSTQRSDGTSKGTSETTTEGGRTASGGTSTTQTGTTKETAHRAGLEAARRILSGRSGMSPQALLMEYESFVLNSRSLDWLCGELEPAFFQIERSL